MSLFGDDEKWRELERITAERFADPQVGDTFEEMYSCWIHVLAVEPDGGKVTCLAHNGGGRVGEIGRIETYDSVTDFADAYGDHMKYHRRENVEGWLEAYAGKPIVDRSQARRDHEQRMEALRRPKSPCTECGRPR